MIQNPTKPVNYLRHGVITLSAALAVVTMLAIPASAQEILFDAGQAVGDNVGSFQISPDGTQVAFFGNIADGITDGQRTYVGSTVPGPDLGSGLMDAPRIGTNPVVQVTQVTWMKAWCLLLTDSM